MNIIQHIRDHFLQVAENLLELLEKGIDYPSFEQRLRTELNELGKKICRDVLEACDQYLKENRVERPGWVVKRNDEIKNIVTLFGQVTYNRTYYWNKHTGEYAHLVDRLAGYGPHARVDTALKADLIDTAVEMSYRKSGMEPERKVIGTAVSGQTVMNTIRKYFSKAKSEQRGQGEAVRKAARVLYIEADEDHVARQGGKSILVPLVYVHEGWEKAGKGYRLKGVHYISGLYSDVEDLWLTVWDYIERTYDENSIERIYIAGDGAAWIKKGLEILPKTYYVLDRFHLEKYITRALNKEPELQKQLREALQECNLAAVEAVLKAAIKKAPTEKRKKAIQECRRYIKRNWEGIEIYKRYPEEIKGCSAEGHVSHILSARMSSRPGGWSTKGADQMARLRAMKANGINLRETYLAQNEHGGRALIKISQKVLNQQKRAGKELREQLDNIPVMKGPVSYLTKVLKALIRPA